MTTSAAEKAKTAKRGAVGTAKTRERLTLMSDTRGLPEKRMAANENRIPLRTCLRHERGCGGQRGSVRMHLSPRRQQSGPGVQGTVVANGAMLRKVTVEAGGARERGFGIYGQ